MFVDYHQFAIVALFIFLDIASGIGQAVANKTLSSEKMRQGIYHKLGYVLTIALALLCEYSTTYLDLGFTAPLLTPCIVMISLTEVVSIAENIRKLNPDTDDLPIFKIFANPENRKKDNEQN